MFVRYLMLSLLLPLFSPLSFAGHSESFPEGPILRGPLLGSPAPDSITAWLQTSRPISLLIRAIPEDSSTWEEGIISNFIELNSDNRLMGMLHIDKLEPDTRYRYRIEDRNGVIWTKEDASFLTPPKKGKPVHFSFAAGSGANHWIEDRPEVWKAIAEDHPDFFLALGDTPYADGQMWFESQAWKGIRHTQSDNSSFGIHQERMDIETAFRRKARSAIPLAYEQFREAPGFSDMTRKSFWVATWDDHDTGIDNGDRENPVIGIALENLKAFTPNPSFGLEGTPGSFWQLSWGDVDFFLLDDQTYRTPTRDALKHPENATILGEIQLSWLLDHLRESRAQFKFIVSGSPFNDNSRKHDSWTSYPGERKKIVDAIISSKINGVILISGDVHRSEIFSLPWLEDSGGYPLYEVVASPLYQRARSCGPAIETRRFCIGSAENKITELYAWIEIDTSTPDAFALIQIRGLENEVFFSEKIRLSDLKWDTDSMGIPE